MRTGLLSIALLVEAITVQAQPSIDLFISVMINGDPPKVVTVRLLDGGASDQRILAPFDPQRMRVINRQAGSRVELEVSATGYDVAHGEGYDVVNNRRLEFRLPNLAQHPLTIRLEKFKRTAVEEKLDQKLKEDQHRAIEQWNASEQDRIKALPSWEAREKATAALALEYAQRQDALEITMLELAWLRGESTNTPTMKEFLRIREEESPEKAIEYVASRKSKMADDHRKTKIPADGRRHLLPRYEAARLLGAIGRYEEAVTWYQELLQLDPLWSEVYDALFWRLTLDGDRKALYEALPAVRLMREKADSIAHRFVAALPNDQVAQRDLSVSYNNLGDLLLQEGKGVEARRAYEDGLAISRKLAQGDPHNAQAQRDLSISYNKLGDLLLQEGKGVEARRAYEDGLAISRKLAQDDPHNAQAQRDLSVSYSKLGDLLRQEGKGVEARTAYEEDLRISRKLAEADPHNAQAQRDLSVSYSKLGDLLLQEGKGVEARTAYEDGLAISRKLAEADAHNAQAQRDLSVSYTKLGDLLRQEGKGVEARKAYEDGLAISRKLAEADAHNAQAQRDLSISYERLGDLLLQEGKKAEATAQFFLSRMIGQRLALASPDMPEMIGALAYPSIRIAHIEMTNKRYDAERLLAITDEARLALEHLRSTGSFPDRQAAQLRTIERIQFELKLSSKERKDLEFLRAIDGRKEALSDRPGNAGKSREQARIIADLEKGSKKLTGAFRTVAEQRIAAYHGSLSWYCLFDRRFAEAQQAAERGLQLDPSEVWINTNLALAHLYQGHYQEAAAIYQRMKVQQYGEGTYRATFLEDLDALEAEGITHPDVARARALLAE
ncbi:MAG: tetratricopeptide repeat protein [Flavobacteriales bacterium]|nr:tetratricopeptide repeat protein [Flavobacteriales bacterium]